MSRIYLDYNAGAPLRPAVLDAMHSAMREGLLDGNPSSVHAVGRLVYGHISGSRAIIASSLGVRARDVVFTSGGTEACNFAMQACIGGVSSDGMRSGYLLIAESEHACVRAYGEVARARRLGYDYDFLPCFGSGLIDLVALETALSSARVPPLVAVMLANNESGVIQPISEISTLVHRYGGRLFCDAVSAFGKIPIDVSVLGADYLSISAHKIGGPSGVGALIILGDSPPPLILGGGQEMRRRAGTENVLGIIGFAAAVSVLGSDTLPLEDWRDDMEANLRSACPEVVIIGDDAPRLSNTSLIGVPMINAATLLMALDLDNVAVSSGAACSSGKVESSHVLLAMGHDNLSAIRVSGGWHTKPDDMTTFTHHFLRHVSRLAA